MGKVEFGVVHFSCRCQRLAAFPVLVAIVILLVSTWARGFPQPLHDSPVVSQGRGSELGRPNLGGLPDTPTGLEGRSDSILITPELFRDFLPYIPNLQAGYLCNFGNSVSSGRLTLDYVLPIPLDDFSSAVFGEAHTEFQDFWKAVTGGANNRLDLSVGGGYRTLFNQHLLVGLNGFYDAARLGSRWYDSGGLGLQMEALIAGNDAMDLNFNWYGNLFNADVLASAFKRGPCNFDFQAGYSHELYPGGPDLRLNMTGYKFSSAGGVYGLRAGAELKTRDGMFSIKYEAAHDRINGAYHSVGGLINMGLKLERLLHGESPFVRPEPIFRSPRNLRRLLSQPVRRQYYQPASVVVSRSGDGGSPRVCDGFNTITVSGPSSGTYSALIPGDNQFMPLRSGGLPDMYFSGGVVPVSSICPDGVTRILVTLRNSNASANPATDVQVVVLIGRNAANQFILSSGSSRESMDGQSTRTFEIIAPNMQALLVANNISPDEVRVRVRHRTEVGGTQRNRTFRVFPAGVVIQFNYH